VAPASMTITAKTERTDQGEQFVLPGAVGDRFHLASGTARA
jgi:hypothetical protein